MAACTHRKGLNRSHTTAEVMDDSMNVQCHGPTLPEWDPVPAAESWFISGKRGRRQVSTKSECKGKKGIQCQRMPEPEALAAAVLEQLGNWQPGDVVPPPCTLTHCMVLPCFSSSCKSSPRIATLGTFVPAEFDQPLAFHQKAAPVAPRYT